MSQVKREAESDTSINIAVVAAIDRKSNEVLCNVMENSQFVRSLLGDEENYTAPRRCTR